jgi:hypothetical protein
MLLRSPRSSGIAIALLAVAMLVCAPVALGMFSDPAPGGPLTVATSTLARPTAVSASQTNCRINRGVELKVTWSATSSTYATSYTVERATASSGPFSSVSSVAIGQTSYIDNSAALESSTTYYYRVSTVYRSWTAASTVASVKSLGKSCT